MNKILQVFLCILLILQMSCLENGHFQGQVLDSNNVPIGFAQKLGKTHFVSLLFREENLMITKEKSLFQNSGNSSALGQI